MKKILCRFMVNFRKDKKTQCTALLTTLIIAMAVTGLETASSSPSTLLYVDPPTYTALSLGETFNIHINIANADNLQGAQFKLGYNTTILDAIHVAEGPFLKEFGTTYMWYSIKDPQGYVIIGIVILTGGPASGNGTLVTITFQATYNASASCALDLYDTSLSDPEGEPITHEINDGYYQFLALKITVATDKAFYSPGSDNVTISGNLKRDSSPIEGLVALKINLPNTSPVVFRTLQTGTTPAGAVTVENVYPSDAYGNPKSSFKINSQAYFWVTVKNNDTVTRSGYVLITVYDGKKVPLGVGRQTFTILPGKTSNASFPIWIENWAYIGTGTVYATAWTVNEVPYSPENSATFSITASASSTGAQGTSVSSTAVGSYNTTLKPPPVGGNYTVIVRAEYQGQYAEATTKFKYGLRADINNDGKVWVEDLFIFGKTWGRSIGDPKYDPRADFNKNGKVWTEDLFVLGKEWGKTLY